MVYVPHLVDVKGEFILDPGAATVRIIIRVSNYDGAFEFVLPVTAIPGLLDGLHNLVDANPDFFPDLVRTDFR